MSSLGEFVDQKLREAYQHGYNVGMKDAHVRADKAVYRRGYQAGYSAGLRRADARQEGPVEGHPNFLELALDGYAARELPERAA